MMMLIKILALIAAWIFFFKILKSRNRRLPRLKATIITLIFASLILRLSTDFYAKTDRFIFSLNAKGEIPLSASILKIPPNQNANYCLQFTDHNHHKLQVISQRNDGQYCGEFWNFKKEPYLSLPYKIIDSKQILYWASPSLEIIAPRTGTEETLK
ncbi:Uncharacterised protein [Legionella wadsworthii]|uniref:Uncharacterized protein n=1 Tax=Legionella wadsworthii TaxID=28088 RepID=A0A378LTI5_9GAMM|nr:hypothetical protein [Legionella wadsworthii]STY29162.1 Uncharacterised protein [Legionella wadsworthii]